MSFPQAPSAVCERGLGGRGAGEEEHEHKNQERHETTRDETKRHVRLQLILAFFGGISVWHFFSSL
jgi:hypothetical protein